MRLSPRSVPLSTNGICSGAEKWSAEAREGTRSSKHAWIQHVSGNMVVQWAEPPMVCGEHLSTHEKRRHLIPPFQILSSALTLLLAKSEWAWITVFSTSHVQSGLRLDRQLETDSTGCQTIWGGGGATAKKCSLPASADCWFSEDSREQLRACWRSLGQHPEGKAAVWLLAISPSPPPTTGHRHLCSAVSGQMAMTTHHPKGPEQGPAPIPFCPPVQWHLWHQEPLSLSSRWIFACL